MTPYQQWRHVVARYFPLFVVCILLLIAAISGTVVTVTAAYLRGVPVETAGPLLVGAGLALILALIASNVLLTRGYTQAVVVNQWLAAGCLIISAPGALLLVRHPAIILLGVCAPAVALLVMRSRRYGELVELFRSIRLSHRHTAGRRG